MTDESPLVVERRGRVALIELNRPEALNAVDTGLRRALWQALDDAGRAQDVNAIVLAGRGKAFCSGADLKAAAANPDTSLRRTARTLTHDFQPILECVTRLDKPVIGAINGAAAGFGMSLALACDLLVMAEDAYLLSPFAGIGLIPDGGTAWFLTRRLGYARAFEAMAEGQKLGAQQCLELGLANRVEEPAALRASALKWADELSARAPLALALTKRVARMSLTTTLSEALSLEAEIQTFLVATEDSKEALRAFAEKRPPSFRGS